MGGRWGDKNREFGIKVVKVLFFVILGNVNQIGGLDICNGGYHVLREAMNRFVRYCFQENIIILSTLINQCQEIIIIIYKQTGKLLMISINLTIF